MVGVVEQFLVRHLSPELVERVRDHGDHAVYFFIRLLGDLRILLRDLRHVHGARAAALFLFPDARPVFLLLHPLLDLPEQDVVVIGADAGDLPAGRHRRVAASAPGDDDDVVFRGLFGLSGLGLLVFHGGLAHEHFDAQGGDAGQVGLHLRVDVGGLRLRLLPLLHLVDLLRVYLGGVFFVRVGPLLLHLGLKEWEQLSEALLVQLLHALVLADDVLGLGEAGLENFGRVGVRRLGVPFIQDRPLQRWPARVTL